MFLLYRRCRLRHIELFILKKSINRETTNENMVLSVYCETQRSRFVDNFYNSERKLCTLHLKR